MSLFFSRPRIRCQVESCMKTTSARRLAAGWELDAKGRPFCADHPVETACRICGRDKGQNRVLCSPCIRA